MSIDNQIGTILFTFGIFLLAYFTITLILLPVIQEDQQRDYNFEKSGLSILVIAGITFVAFVMSFFACVVIKESLSNQTMFDLSGDYTNQKQKKTN
ncbi:hypothetical protein RFI_08351 [Reticulomyxa filosa]|uniref:Dolichol phosphate-mannose biosynthesis regulatory protein n=1 Tax=Reticulomyxa filosa TaxID=46433 RepID=X6NR37_RETFI|nr:hypothetical protein RFI_08351 [Reticulomyxa filosa]|eukprot:ETO28775.1 hypothetical protein RFI_08351 [Reticulomyxa filosa]